MNRPPVDLRSDTVTQPTAEMRRAMAEAEVGDDFYREDPTVLRLEESCAEMLGHEAALFMPSGSMANQVAVHLHTRPGDEALVEATGHSYDWELSGMSVISGVQARPVAGDRGVLTADSVEPEIIGRPAGRAAVGLVIAENTHNMAGGRVWPRAATRALQALCAGQRLPIHLDGARLFNAAVAAEVPAAELAAGFDSVMVSLSKGLCAPAGSLLVGEESFIDEAVRVRKLLGGGMRQVGVLAAAGEVALSTMIDRLAEDHTKARKLADGLVATGALELAFGHCDTNIVVIDVAGAGMSAAQFCERIHEHGVLCGFTAPTQVRMLTHRDVTDEGVERVVAAARQVVAGC